MTPSREREKALKHVSKTVCSTGNRIEGINGEDAATGECYTGPQNDQKAQRDILRTRHLIGLLHERGISDELFAKSLPREYMGTNAQMKQIRLLSYT